MLPHNMTDQELLNIDSTDPLVIELQERLQASIGTLESVRQYVDEIHITYPYVDKNDKERSLEDILYHAQNDLERYWSEELNLAENELIQKVLALISLADTVVLHNNECEENYTYKLKDLLAN
jgi:hypothetical protein